MKNEKYAACSQSAAALAASTAVSVQGSSRAARPGWRQVTKKSSAPLSSPKRNPSTTAARRKIQKPNGTSGLRKNSSPAACVPARKPGWTL